jgi:hypothetical protein
MSQGPQDDELDPEVRELLVDPEETAEYVGGEGSEEEP